jgi:hypothetical protein
LKSGTTVTVSGKIEDGWYQVHTTQGNGWVIGNLVDLQGCDPTLYSLAYSLQIDSSTLFQDSFRNVIQTWQDISGQPLNFEYEPNAGGDYQLIIPVKTQQDASGKSSAVPVEISANGLSSISNFRFFTAFDRINLDDRSYIGIRYGDVANSYFEVRILGDCKINVILQTDSGFAPVEISRPFQVGDNSCSDSRPDYLEIRWDGTNVTVYINGVKDPFTAAINISIPEPNKLTIVTYDGVFKLGFVLVTQNP